MRPRILDLFCCEGGAGAGYHAAGWDVVGVDLEPRFAKRYPFEFHAGDAIEFVKVHGHEFDAIHASPPCQHASAGTRTLRARGLSKHPALIEPTREVLEASGKPWVIENVSGAALRNPSTLCGTMFGLRTHDEDGHPLHLERHRLFESNVELVAPGPCAHSSETWAAGVYGGARGRKPGQTAAEHRHSARYERHGGYVPTSTEVQQRLLGINWMTKAGMAQSIPPVYAKHVGLQVMAALATPTTLPVQLEIA